MTISVHCQTSFEDYAFFEKKMNEVVGKYPEITSCITGRSKATEYAKLFFKDSDVSCTQQKPKNYKIQNLYNIIENTDLSIFFYRDDIKVGSDLTGKTIRRAGKLHAEGKIQLKSERFEYGL